ncbi:MAG: BTAD domain-containing putative transcriptional regulator [Candidatus Eisenbacteria bacterium]
MTVDSIAVNPHAPWIAMLERSRLEARREELRAARLILVTAGAGYGKSTFLRQLAEAEARPVAWVRETLEPSGIALGLTRALLSPDARAPEPLSALIDHLWSRPTFVVIDPLPPLAAGSAERDLLAQLARHLPEGSTLVLSSRERPALPIARLEAARAVVKLEATDLRFEQDEVASLFELRFGAQPAPRLVRRVLHETEGWPAGVELLLQAAGSADDAAVDGALDRRRGASASWFEFYAQEALELLDPEARRFLLEAAALPRLSANECDRWLGRKDSAGRMRALLSSHLFLEPLVAADGAYRLHAPFRDFLLARQEAELPESARRRLHLRAARAWKREGRAVEAALALLRAGEADRALDCLEPTRGDRGALDPAPDDPAVGEFFVRVPSRLVERRPRALLLLARRQEHRGEWEDALRTAERALKLDATPLLRAELAALRARTLTRWGRHEVALRVARAAVGALPGSRSAASVRGQLLCTQANAQAELGRLREAEATLEDAIALARRARDRRGEGRALYLLAANVHQKRGEFRTAEQAARRALDLYKREGEARWICHALEVVSETVRSQGRLGEARDLARLSLATAEDLDYRMAEGYCQLVLARAARSGGDLAEAERHAERAREIGSETGEAELRVAPLIELADLYARGNRREAARAQAELAARETEVLSGRILCARVDLAVGVLTAGRRGRELRARAETTFRRAGARFELHRAQLLRLALDDPPRQERRAARALIAGVARAEHDTLFLHHEPERGAALLLEATAAGLEREWCFALLRRLQPAGFVDAAVELEPCEDRGASTLPLRLNLLGPISIERGEDAWPLGAWKSRRALRLFLFLVTRRFRWISRDELLEALWPELDLDRALNNLKQSVFLLRRQLEPAREPRFLLHRGESYRLEPGVGHDYDVERFEAALAEADSAARRARAPEEEKALTSAIAAYRGDWCEELPYEEFLAAERERLRERWLGAIERLLHRFLSSARPREAIDLARRGLERDPLRESFHDSLTAALEALGRVAEAESSRRQFERAYVREFGLYPRARARALRNRRAS